MYFCKTNAKKMRLPVFEMFYSVQGEGENIGMPAYFVRLAGCNVACPFCDEKKAWSKDNSKLMDTAEIVDTILKSKAKNVVITGGEPTIYDLTELTEKLKEKNIKIFLETSGVNEVRGLFSHITLSPKQHLLPLCKKDSNSSKEVFASRVDSLKVVISSKSDFAFAERMKDCLKKESPCSLFLQPEWNRKETIIPEIIDYIKQNPEWNLSLQTHKYINVK